MKKAPIFPNGQSLQPIPQDVYPNISGNVNSTTKYTVPIENTTIVVSELTLKEDQSINKTSSNPFILWMLLLLFIIIFILIYSKLKKKDNSI